MKKLLFYAKILFIVCLFAWIAYKFDYAAAKKILSTARIAWGALAVILTFLSNLFLTVRWQMIIRGFWKQPRTSTAKLLWYNLLAVFYTLFLPTSIAGEAVRVWRLGKDEDKDYTKATFTVILDRLIGVSTWFIIFISMPSVFPKNRLLLLAFLVPVALYIFRDKIAYKEKKLMDFSRHHPLDIAYAVALSVLCQFAYIVAGYATFKCLNLEIGFLAAAGIVAAGAMINLIPVSLLGFGAREGFLIAALPLYGAAPTQAVLVTSFLVFLTYVAGIAGGLIELANTGWNLSGLKSPDTSAVKDNEKT